MAALNWLFSAVKGSIPRVVVHYQGQPQAQAADLNGLLLDVDAKEAILHDVLLGIVQPSRAFAPDRVHITVGNRSENPAEIHQLVEQSHRKSTGAHCRITTLERRYEISELDRLVFRGESLSQTVIHVFVEPVRRVHLQKRSQSSCPFFSRQPGMEVLVQHFAANEMDNDSWSVVGAGRLALVRGDSVRIGCLRVKHDGLKYLPQHFRVNRHFLIERSVFGDGKVEGFKKVVEYVREGGVAHFERRVNLPKWPELIVIEQASVQKRHSLQASALARRRTERPEELVQEIAVVVGRLGLGAIFLQLVGKIALLLVEPAAILQKVEKNESFE